MTGVRGLVITGPFTEADIKRFAELLREIERERPDRIFSLVMADPEGEGMGHALELVQRIFPARERVQ